MLYRFRNIFIKQWETKDLETLLKKRGQDDLIAQLGRLTDLRGKIILVLENFHKLGAENPQDLNRLLEEYLPMLDTFFTQLSAAHIKYIGTIQIVATSLIDRTPNKYYIIDREFKGERALMYFLYAVTHYQMASQIHRTWCQTSKETSSATDTVNTLKGIIKELQRAAGIWQWCSENLFGSQFRIMPQKGEKIIPDLHASTCDALACMALCNAQEFVVQIAVTEKKSPSTVAKVAMGVSKRLKSGLNDMGRSLGQLFNGVSQTLQLYMSARSDLYQAIARKYMGQNCWDTHEKDHKKVGESIAHYRLAIAALKRIRLPPKCHVILEILKSSVQRQIENTQRRLEEVESENNMVYFQSIPDQGSCADIDPVMLSKAVPYEPQVSTFHAEAAAANTSGMAMGGPPGGDLGGGAMGGAV